MTNLDATSEQPDDATMGRSQHLRPGTSGDVRQDRLEEGSSEHWSGVSSGGIDELDVLVALLLMIVLGLILILMS